MNGQGGVVVNHCIYASDDFFVPMTEAALALLTDVIIEAQQGSTKFSIGLHDDPDARSDALVDQLEGQDGG